MKCVFLYVHQIRIAVGYASWNLWTGLELFIFFQSITLSLFILVFLFLQINFFKFLFQIMLNKDRQSIEGYSIYTIYFEFWGSIFGLI